MTAGEVVFILFELDHDGQDAISVHSTRQGAEKAQVEYEATHKNSITDIEERTVQP